MKLVTLEYEERADGLLYPIIDMGEDKINQLGKFGKARLEYLHSEKLELYKELLITGKLAKHCEEIENRADVLHEKLFQTYLNNNPVGDDDFHERVAVFNGADIYANEIVLAQVINL